MTDKENSVAQIIESVCGEICNHYCKYPDMPIPEGKDEDWLMEDDDAPCANCPLSRLQ